MPAQRPKVHTSVRPRGGTRGFVESRPEERIDVTASYTLEEAAAHLQISKRALNRLIEAGRIGYLRVNQRQRRILGRQILDFQERNSKGPFR